MRSSTAMCVYRTDFDRQTGLDALVDFSAPSAIELG